VYIYKQEGVNVVIGKIPPEVDPMQYEHLIM